MFGGVEMNRDVHAVLRRYHHCGNAPRLDGGSAAVVLADQQWSRKRGLTPVARLASCGIAALFVLLAGAFPAFAHEHPKDNPDSRFLNTLERPDNAVKFVAQYARHVQFTLMLHRPGCSES
jgi:hypothetical protein